MKNKDKFHFIDPGNGITCDLAVALIRSSASVTVSGEAFSDESKSKLLKVNILPDKMGWFPEKVNDSLKGVIIGSAIHPDNPEIKKARDLKLRIQSVPEFIYDYSIDKQRIVVAGSTGKNIISLLIIHTLTYHKRKFDYAISTSPVGKDCSVSLSNAPLIVIEGQDVSSSQDASPDFLKYHHHIGVLSDIEWHPGSTVSREDYVKQFGLFETSLPKSGILLYNEKDPTITSLLALNVPDVLYVPYAAHPSVKEQGQEWLITDKEHYPLKITGQNALLNMNAAKDTLKKLGISSSMFYQAIRSFQPPGR